ncbi:DUF2750 domain-containing protein [Micromonosporaceae bacterium Da 78-11]
MPLGCKQQPDPLAVPVWCRQAANWRWDATSASGAQAAAFFRDLAGHGIVWWVRDDEGSPTFPGAVFPYWSTRARAQRAARIWGPEFQAEPMPVAQWRARALPDLDKDGYRVGIIWSGPRLTGWDFTVPEVLNRLAYAFGEPPYDRPDVTEDR